MSLWTRVALIVVFLATLLAWLAFSNPGFQSFLGGIFGPPRVELKESYEEMPDGAVVDHRRLDALLKRFVDAEGFVDYRGLKEDRAALESYLEELRFVDFWSIGRDEKLALLINAYNAATLLLIVERHPLDSIKDIPRDERWKDERWRLIGKTLSLSQIEHEQIRPHFLDARIHFALVCAAKSCPKLRREAYVGVRIEEQLESQAKGFHADARWYRFRDDQNRVELSPLYHPTWYGGDFEQVAESTLAFVARYDTSLAAALEAGRDVKIDWLDYDWSLNEAQ